MVERIDVRNIFEIQKIQKILVKHPDLLSMLEIIIIMCNDRLNQQEKPILNLPLEDDDEPNLSDHSSDEELTEHTN